MTVLFGRSVEVAIGQKGQVGRVISGLRVTFDIEKSLEKDPNKATVEIYNLSKQTLALVEDSQAYIVLRAGYGSTLKTLYQGDIAKLATKRNGPDKVTSFECSDGEVELTTKTAELSFEPGAKFGQVFDTISGQLGFAPGKQQGINRNDTFLSGVSFSGFLGDSLSGLLGKQDLDWSVQDGQLQVLPPLGSTDEEVVVLTNETGLIGNPQRVKVINAALIKSKDVTKQNSGVSLVSLLNPEFRPGRRVKVMSREVTGVYRIQKINHKGDTHGQDYYSTLECIE